jgi:hypothetical protein
MFAKSAMVVFMRKVRRIGLAVTVSLLCGLLVYTGQWWHEHSDLDRESRRFADEAILAVTQRWNKDELLIRGTPDLRNDDSSRQTAELFSRLARLGDRISYGGAKGEATILFLLNGPGSISASYVAFVKCSNGSALIHIEMAKVGGSWWIKYFHVDAKLSSNRQI